MISINLETPRRRRPPVIPVFTRITTPRFTRDTDELRTWVMDIRQVLAANAIRDMVDETDAGTIAALPTVVPVPIGNGVVGSHLLGGWDDPRPVR